MRYIYKIKFKGKGDVVAETQAEALQKLREQLNGLDIEYLDIVGADETPVRPEQLIEEMQMLFNLTRSAYEFNARNTDRTDYSNGYDKGYLHGMEEMLKEMKGIMYGNQNEQMGR